MEFNIAGSENEDSDEGDHHVDSQLSVDHHSNNDLKIMIQDLTKRLADSENRNVAKLDETIERLLPGFNREKSTSIRSIIQKKKKIIEEEREILKIVDKRMNKDGLYYKVIYSDKTTEWVNKRSLIVDGYEKLKEFDARDETESEEDSGTDDESHYSKEALPHRTLKTPPKPKKPLAEKEPRNATKKKSKLKKTKQATTTKRTPRKASNQQKYNKKKKSIPKKKQTPKKVPETKKVKITKKRITTKNVPSTKKARAARKVRTPAKITCCQLNHRSYSSFKEEINKAWFAKNQLFQNSSCFICHIKIEDAKTDNNTVPTANKPCFICVNSHTKNCKKCLCNSCYTKIVNEQSANESGRRSNRRNKT